MTLSWTLLLCLHKGLTCIFRAGWTLGGDRHRGQPLPYLPQGAPVRPGSASADLQPCNNWTKTPEVPPPFPTCRGGGNHPKTLFPGPTWETPGGSCHAWHSGQAQWLHPRTKAAGMQPRGTERARGLRGNSAKREPQGSRMGWGADKQCRAKGTFMGDS